MKKQRVNLDKLTLNKQTLSNMDQLQGGSWPNTSGMGGYSPTCGPTCTCTTQGCKVASIIVLSALYC